MKVIQVITLEASIRALQFGDGFLWLSIIFVLLAVLAAAVGASGVAGLNMAIAKWFILLFVVAAILVYII